MTAAGTTAGPGTPNATPSPPPRERRPWIDQARWVAMILIVVGHLMGLLRSHNDLAAAVSNWVYVFHIPVFILLAGWGAGHAPAGGKHLSRIFWQLLVPYAVFQVVAFGVNWVVDGDSPSWVFTQQTFGLWFLVALAWWRLAAPWLNRARGALLIALAISLLAGASTDLSSFLALDRVAYFLPIFIAGPRIVELAQSLRKSLIARVLSIAALVGSFAIIAALGDGFDRTIFFGRAGYEELGHGLLLGPIMRLGALALATLLATALIVAIPGRGAREERFGAACARGGRRTMYPYLMHLPLLTVLSAWDPTQGWPPTTAALAGIALGIVFTIVFTSNAGTFLLRPFVEPGTLVPRALRIQRD